MAIWERYNFMRKRGLGLQEVHERGTQSKRHHTPHLQSLRGNNPFCLWAPSAALRTKAFPRFERKRALKITKCWCTSVKQVRWAIHRNFNTHLIRGCFKITYLLFLDIVLWFRQVAFTGNQGKKFPPTSHAPSPLKIIYFFFLSSSWFLITNQKKSVPTFPSKQANNHGVWWSYGNALSCPPP